MMNSSQNCLVDQCLAADEGHTFSYLRVAISQGAIPAVLAYFTRVIIKQ